MNFLRHPKNKNDGYFDHRQNEQNAHFLQKNHKMIILGMFLSFLMLYVLLKVR